ncbi:MAG: ribulose-phosphate 3-epimerase [Clostridia bacterium]|nr:ribulose-phosphate 3-epimerase [Clostridia bacterium]
MIKISPSILASDFANLESELARIEKGGADYAHIDVMDGVFVPNITLGPCIVKAMRPTSKLVFDVHLMITKPERYVKDFAEAGADIITIHYEATDDPAAVLKEIRSLGCRAGIVIKPKTSPEVVRPLLDLCDMVLVMTVEPGFGGQSLIPSTLDSVRAIRQMIDESGRKVDLEVDGGISPSNVKLVTDAGANVIVAGSAVFKSEDIPATIAALKA